MKLTIKYFSRNQSNIFLEICVSSEDCVLGTTSLHGHPSLLILPNLLLEKVSLALQGDVLHEVEGVGGVVEFITVELQQESVRHELDVLHHQLCIHTDQSDWKSLCEELTLDVHSVSDYLIDPLLTRLVDQVSEHEAGEVSVETFVSRYQLVAEAQTWHQTSLLQPRRRRRLSQRRWRCRS